jgi:hypothetical protein
MTDTEIRLLPSNDTTPYQLRETILIKELEHIKRADEQMWKDSTGNRALFRKTSF